MSAPVEERESRLAGRVNELRYSIRQVDPATLAQKTGAIMDDHQLALPIWGTDIVVPFPNLIAQNAHSGKELDLLDQAILAYYFYTADGTRPAGQWMSFSELPEGRFYIQAFQGYTGRELAQAFGNDVEAFTQAALQIGGQPYPFGEVAFRFQALPFVPILVACWLGDEEMLSSYRILFDAHVAHHLPTDGCAIVGSRLTAMLIRGTQFTR